MGIGIGGFVTEIVGSGPRCEILSRFVTLARGCAVLVEGSSGSLTIGMGISAPMPMPETAFTVSSGSCSVAYAMHGHEHQSVIRRHQ